MNPRPHVKPVLAQQPVANSDDDCDLNNLARQTLAEVPANLLPPEPFPVGFDIEALTTSRSSRPGSAPHPPDDDARVDLRAATQGIAPLPSAPPRSLPPPKRSSVPDLAPAEPSAAPSSGPPRALPALKRSRVVDLAPAQPAAPRRLDPELDELIAQRAFAPSSAWSAHAAQAVAAAKRAPSWAWGLTGALAVGFVWLVSGSSNHAPAPALAAAPTNSVASPETSPAQQLAAIQFPHSSIAAAPRVDSRAAYNRARPALGSAAAPAPAAPIARSQMPAPQAPSTQERSIDTLLDQALTSGGVAGPVSPAPRAKGSGLPDLPPRTAVATVFGSLFARVRFCAGNRSGVAIAHVVVRHDGRVSSARITGAPFSNAASGACMEGVIRSAQFPAFEQSTFNVTYPFQL